MTPLFRALLVLWAISLGTALLTRLAPEISPVLVAALLVLAGMKARIILNDYLELRSSGFWRRGFNGLVAVFLVLAFGIYLVPIL
ncbi:MAG: nitric oxide reductase F protein [Rhodobacteraceae bacterium]|nr:nitric oxide reductase F protein [Paracoccaceae bacterium]